MFLMNQINLTLFMGGFGLSACSRCAAMRFWQAFWRGLLSVATPKRAKNRMPTNRATATIPAAKRLCKYSYKSSYAFY